MSLAIQTWAALSPEAQRSLLQRPVLKQSDTLSKTVQDIVQQVRSEGDAAVLKLGRQFDCATQSELVLTESAKEKAINSLSIEVKQAIELAYQQIKAFHQAQKMNDIAVENLPGVRCELRTAPLASVGLYVPGGSAPLPSTVLMLGATAQVAGCPQRFLCTPANKNAEVAAEIVYAAQLCGIENIYLAGGAQAIAAMAYGTETIPRADKIFGPGNSFVTETKQQVSSDPQGAAIDMPAGPSEVLVIADANANPVFVAADLLSQAEHGPDSQVILVSDSEALLNRCRSETLSQLEALPRAEIARAAIENSRFILANDIQQATEISNRYAPEHLIVQTDSPRAIMDKLTNAASIFLGPWSPESAGDYASGTNHVLPTYGFARNYSSLGLADFCRRYTVQELSYEGLVGLGQCIITLAEAEGLDAHKQAVALRLQQGEKP